MGEWVHECEDFEGGGLQFDKFNSCFSVIVYNVDAANAVFAH